MRADLIDVDALAQEIRRVDGNHSLGAGALAEALMPFLADALASQEPVAWRVTDEMVEAFCRAYWLRWDKERPTKKADLRDAARRGITAALAVVPVAARAEAEGWRPIETATAGRWLMWVADSGERGTGQSVFGTVYVWEDGTRSYKPDGHHGDWRVTHCMPLPAAPTRKGEGT